MKRAHSFLWHACLVFIPGYGLGHFFVQKSVLASALQFSIFWTAGIGLIIALWQKPFRPKPADTVVYFLKQGRRIVYIGITYCNRAEKRVYEHRTSGKEFNTVVWSPPMPRHKAVVRERKLIHRYQPQYNIVHAKG